MHDFDDGKVKVLCPQCTSKKLAAQKQSHVSTRPLGSQQPDVDSTSVRTRNSSDGELRFAEVTPSANRSAAPKKPATPVPQDDLLALAQSEQVEAVEKKVAIGAQKDLQAKLNAALKTIKQLKEKLGQEQAEVNTLRERQHQFASKTVELSQQFAAASGKAVGELTAEIKQLKEVVNGMATPQPRPASKGDNGQAPANSNLVVMGAIEHWLEQMQSTPKLRLIESLPAVFNVFDRLFRLAPNKLTSQDGNTELLRDIQKAETFYLDWQEKNGIRRVQQKGDLYDRELASKKQGVPSVSTPSPTSRGEGWSRA